MKKQLLTLCLAASSLAALAQTPRLSLYEEFTGETCPPCAAANPGLDAILASPTNTPKIVAIKWQVPIPSAPSNTWSLYQTNKADIDWRYDAAPAGYGYPDQWTATTTPVTSGIGAAPTGVIDGQHQWAFGSTSNHPGGLTNAVISTAQSFTSAFSVTMNRAWDATYTSFNVTVNIVASANFTANGSLVFRTVMVEKTINFATQPGTNGEKTFHDVAIAAFPSIQSGVSMASTWTVGQSQTFTLNCVVPSYARDKSQIAFVGFIQDDGNRRVAQSVRANPAALPNDAKAISANVPSLACASNFTPEAVINNLGNNAITALTITPYLDGVMGTPFNWTGNLAVGATASIALNSMTPTLAGGHTFSYNITGVSGGDFNALNNTTKQSFYLASSYQGTPVAEAFSVTAFPPQRWGLINANGGPTWSRNSASNGISLTGGTGATKYDFFTNNTVGDADELILPPMDLTGNRTPTLVFDVAYAQYNVNSDDQLEVFVSSDCGVTWQSVYDKMGANLSTTAAQTSAFTAAAGNLSQWRKEQIVLTGFNVSSVLVKFVATSDYGNNMYIDNINLAKANSTVGIKEENQAVSFGLFPNPAKTETTLHITSLNNDAASVKVINVIGQVVMQANTNLHIGENNLTLNTRELPAGIYNVVIDTKNNSTVKKLMIEK